MSSVNYFTAHMREYRLKHPEYDIKDLEKKREKYQNDPDYRERKKQQALARYYRLKEQKQQSISTN